MMIKKTRKKAYFLVFFERIILGLMILGLMTLGTNDALARSSVGLIWVAKPDGSKSCEPESGQSLKDASTELKKAGVKIHSARKASDGKAHIQMCGAATGRLNAFRISKGQLKAAEVAGFKPQKGTPPAE